jgi:polysaccharide export outer membrane protein
LQYKRVNLLLALAILLLNGIHAQAAEDDEVVALAQQQDAANQAPAAGLLDEYGYRVQPGDILHVSVWHEPDLQLDVLVSPNGNFAVPLVGQIQADNKTLAQLQREIADRLEKYVPGADVTVALKQIQGNKVYVIGKVNRPGEFVLNRNVDVMQALSMAGGTTQFADVDDIIILRREQAESQKVFTFDYDEVKQGQNLAQNIILKSGDVVVVP